MSFYDPLAPVFETTRLEIERSIMGLEERLLRRKELDLQLEKDILSQSTIQRLGRHNELYDPLDKAYTA